MTAAWTWNQLYSGANVGIYLWGGLGGGFIAALVTIFKPTVAPIQLQYMLFSKVL